MIMKKSALDTATLKKAILSIVFVLFVNSLCMTDEIKQPTEPIAPVEPTVPGKTDAFMFPRVPVMPSVPLPPGGTAQNKEPIREIERYGLTVSEAYPNGNTRRNVADTISGAQYVLYSNDAVTLILNFKNGPQYLYHLSSPRSKMEVSPGVFRTTYSTVVQVGKEFLLERYTSELFSDANSVTSVNISGNNRTVVILRFAGKL